MTRSSLATKAPAFAAETDLCAAFIAALPEGWTTYAETAGFDILLVRKSDGFQIGVQAKLKLNAVALAQALEGWRWWGRGDGPDCRAVLVPWGADVAGVATLAARLAVTVIRMESKAFNPKHNRIFRPGLPGDYKPPYWSADSEAWHELCHKNRIALPDYVPDVAAGASAPTQLTDWKIKAMKIAIICEVRGFVTRADFRAIHIDPRRWIDSGWMVPVPDGGGFTLTTPWLKEQHPKVYAEIKADIDTWMPKEVSLSAERTGVLPLVRRATA